jgi:hypothetical protein
MVTLQSPVQRNSKRVLASCDILRHKGARGRYEANFLEDCLDEHKVESFLHRPARLNPWQLLHTALAWRLTDEEMMPPRPFIFAPDAIAGPEGREICLANLSEPAKTCFERWLARKGHRKAMQRGFALEALYLDFLHDLA